MLPDVLPSDKQEDYKLPYDIGTTYMFRQQKGGGTRVEAEVSNGQKIVHAYGREAGALPTASVWRAPRASLLSNMPTSFPF